MLIRGLLRYWMRQQSSPKERGEEREGERGGGRERMENGERKLSLAPF